MGLEAKDGDRYHRTNGLSFDFHWYFGNSHQTPFDGLQPLRRLLKLLLLVANFLNLSIEVFGDLSLYTVEHDAQKSLFHLTHAVLILMVEKVELNHPVSELKRTPNLQDFVKPYY
jgi:hypothetical protein